MQAAYIIDANLPFKVPVWKSEDFVFVLQINAAWDDEEIWTYAKEHNLIIVTKDKDFVLKQTIANSPPKLIHIRFGNLRLKDFVAKIAEIWPDAQRLIQTHNIVNVYFHTIEAIK